MNSACLELDDSGNVISYEEYFPFGGSSYRSGSSAAEVSLKRYRYNGKERDEETGFYYYGARYYAPWLCRFISVDPLGMIDAPSLYAYVRNNPIKLTDPDGMQAGGEDEGEDITIVDGSGSKSLISSGSEISEDGSTVTGPNGSKYININGIGLVNETLLDKNEIKPVNPSMVANNSTGYYYDSEDLLMRAKLIEIGEDNPITKSMLKNESEGTFEPLTKSGFIEKYGDASNLIIFGTFLGIAFETMPGFNIKLPSSKGFNLNNRLSGPRSLPRGFSSMKQYQQSMDELSNALDNSGIKYKNIGVRGSSVSGKSTKGLGTFRYDDLGDLSKSDIDVFINLTDDIGLTTSKRTPGLIHPNKMMSKYPALKEWSTKWSKILDRKITPAGLKY